MREIKAGAAIGPRIDQIVDAAGAYPPAGVEGGRYLRVAVRPVYRRDHALAPRQVELDGAFQLSRRESRERLIYKFLFAAEGASHRDLDDADLGIGKPEHLGDYGTDAVDALRGGPDRDSLLRVPVGQIGVRLHGDMVHLLCPDAGRDAECLFLARGELLSLADLFKLLDQVAALMDREGALPQALGGGGHHRQLFIFDLYQPRRPFRRRLSLTGDDGDDVSDEARPLGKDISVLRAVRLLGESPVAVEPLPAVILIAEAGPVACDPLGLGSVYILYQRVADAA
ncbi:hypothetical protein SDC9_146174 [bioreactor metagenome]|uniref:Uncharacterized protein n=1 Tax=bioreactor metagenome TaxID=1076179 RepID=A0A645EAC6_9ZZZZ